MNKNKTEKDIKKKWHANIEKIINSDLREDIMHNTKNLLKRNNMNYEVKKLNEFDSRENQIYYTKHLTPSCWCYTNNISDKDDFSSILREKVLTLKNYKSQSKRSNS